MGELSSLILAQSAQSATTGVNAYSQTTAMRGQQQYSSTMTGVNNNWMELQKQDVLRRGNVGSSRERLQGEHNASSVRARQAGGGVDVNIGSAAIAQSDQRLLAELAKNDAHNNAYMRAIGISSEQSSMLSRDRMNKLATKNQIRNTLLQTGMQGGSDILRAKYLSDRYKGLGGNGIEPEDDWDMKRKNAVWGR